MTRAVFFSLSLLLLSLLFACNESIIKCEEYFSDVLFFSAFEVGPFYSGKCARRVKKYRGDLFVLSQFCDVQN